MKNIIYAIFVVLIASNTLFAQSIDEPFSRKKMQKDLELFRNIRTKANSGVHRYRTKKQIDSMYQWAEAEINSASTYREFYNIITQITDFEGSVHNYTGLPDKQYEFLKTETTGYFPYPIKSIEGKWIINHKNDDIPLGAEIMSINAEPINAIIKNMYKYYTTDGLNISGKQIGIWYNFAKYYRLHYGLTNSFEIVYKAPGSNTMQSKELNGVSHKTYYANLARRYSRPFDSVNWKDWKEEEIYDYKQIDSATAMLTINDFGLGNASDPKHLRYRTFLDSNGGGQDPNDLVTYGYLTQRNFQENKKAWMSFRKIPYLKHVDSKIPAFLRPFGVGKYNRLLQQDCPIEVDGRFYQDENNSDHKSRTPEVNAFSGNIYLLISPRVASAGSLFAAMVTGNDNTTVIGEETMGGYYGHNGHTPMDYILPKSKLEFSFYIVNLEQDVPKKANQKYDRGIIPDHHVTQTYADYLTHADTQLNYVLALIQERAMEETTK